MSSLQHRSGGNIQMEAWTDNEEEERREESGRHTGRDKVGSQKESQGMQPKE